MKSSKPRKMKPYASFAAWKAGQSERNRKLITALERLVQKEAPELETGVKWGQGCWFDGVVHVMYIHAEPDHVQFGFYGGADMRDPRKLLRGSGKHVRHVRVETLQDIDPAAFSGLIAQVI